MLSRLHACMCLVHVGEIRGAEAFDFLQVMNTGHSGTLSTISANSCLEALSRLAICVLQSDVNLPYPAINRSIGESLRLVVHLARKENGKRIVDEVIRIKGYDHRASWYDLETLFDSPNIASPPTGGGAESKSMGSSQNRGCRPYSRTAAMIRGRGRVRVATRRRG